MWPKTSLSCNRAAEWCTDTRSGCSSCRGSAGWSLNLERLGRHVGPSINHCLSDHFLPCTALYRSLTQCFVASTMESRLRTASSQEKTDVLAWMSWGVNLWSVGFPAKGKQPPTSVKTLISKDGSCFLCLTASGACLCKKKRKKKECLFY